jgi:TolB protein
VTHTRLGDQIEHSAIGARNLDGSGLKIILHLDRYQGDLQSPRVSPDGRLLLVDRYNAASARPAGGDALFVTAVNGGASRQLTPWRLSAGSPDWSPDGKQVLFKRSIPGASELTPGTNLYTIRVNGKGLRRVTNVGSNHYVLAGSFSPDGTSIVFATDAEAAANPNAAQPFADVFTMRINGTNLKPATRTPNLDGWPTWGSPP